MNACKSLKLCWCCSHIDAASVSNKLSSKAVSSHGCGLVQDPNIGNRRYTHPHCLLRSPSAANDIALTTYIATSFNSPMTSVISDVPELTRAKQADASYLSLKPAGHQHISACSADGKRSRRMLAMFSAFLARFASTYAIFAGGLAPLIPRRRQQEPMMLQPGRSGEPVPDVTLQLMMWRGSSLCRALYCQVGN